MLFHEKRTAVRAVTKAGLRAVAAAGVLGGLALAAAPAQALVNLTLTYEEPTGAVPGTATIPVVVRITNNGPENFEIISGTITQGISVQDVRDFGFGFDDDDDPLTPDTDPTTTASFGAYGYFECSGSFFSGCGGNPGDPYNAFFSVGLPQDLFLAPTESTLVEAIYFEPVGFSAPSGLYTFYNLGFGVNGFDADGNRVAYLDYAFTCRGSDPRCAFTRDVTGVAGVPEPASWAMMIAGFGLLGGAVRRRTASVRFV